MDHARQPKCGVRERNPKGPDCEIDGRNFDGKRNCRWGGGCGVGIQHGCLRITDQCPSGLGHTPNACLVRRGSTSLCNDCSCDCSWAFSKSNGVAKSGSNRLWLPLALADSVQRTLPDRGQIIQPIPAQCFVRSTFQPNHPSGHDFHKALPNSILRYLRIVGMTSAK
jgi:hypothetical protein